jgi:hypothetical protein
MADMQDTTKTEEQRADRIEQVDAGAGLAELSTCSGDLIDTLFSDFPEGHRAAMKRRVESGQHPLGLWLSERRQAFSPDFSAVGALCEQRFNSARDAEDEPEA